MRTHPFQTWPRRHRRLAFGLVLGATLVITVLAAVAAPLPEEATIIDFELAGSVERTQEILGIWRREGVVDDAKAIQLFDLVYPLIYGAALAGACVAGAGAWKRAGRAGPAAAGIALAWVATAAIAFDYVENLGLAVSLWGDPASPWPQLAAVAGALKFAGTALALVYGLATLVAAPLRRYPSTRRV
jgi:hypothetical protein